VSCAHAHLRLCFLRVHAVHDDVAMCGALTKMEYAVLKHTKGTFESCSFINTMQQLQTRIVVAFGSSALFLDVSFPRQVICLFVYIYAAA
jgi:hypothetical protein